VDASALNLVDAPCAQWEDHWKPPQVSPDAQGAIVRLQGAFPRRCEIKQALNLIDRDQLDPLALLHLWRGLGGDAPRSGVGVAPADARVVAQHLARPLGELVRGVMKRSDNALTRLIYLQLGANANGQPTRAAADARVRAWLKTKALDDASLVLDNGSGLSRSERLSPTLLAQVLVSAAQGRNAPELLASLPVAGVDGTMSRRLKGSPAEGRARLKTGTLSNAVGLAGFVPDAQNRLWVVVALLNHPEASAKGRPVLDALIDALARQP
jgi:D-alanyl-D-alanine carboxypeptidase/D-alanyl-D-alanine-endopeptidase (penicillin-binding protein 4)